MGYRAGGFGVDDPFVYCNGCGTRRSVYTKTTYGPYKWFLNGKAAPGWFGGRVDGTHVRFDMCHPCVKKLLAIAEEVSDG
jgi:hypothetical protein